MKSAFSKTEMATQTLAPTYKEDEYLERTKRNHFWIGGPEGQFRLRDMKIGVAGLGGMGSNLAEIFVRLGVGHIKIADPDTIERSNLNRQVIANKNTIGTKKALASAYELRNIAEDFELVVYDEGITKENAKEFVSDLDLIVDEIDVFPFPAHVHLHQAARPLNLPLYSGYVIGMGTHVYKFQGADFTFEDFMLNNKAQLESPTLPFIMDRFLNPPPDYLNNTTELNRLAQTAQEDGVPIFGASTYISQSLIAIRVISDFLDLNSKWGGPKTPVMPRFLKLDPFQMSFDIHDIREVRPLPL